MTPIERTAPPARPTTLRRYEAPRLTVLGPATTLTRDPQVRPSGSSDLVQGPTVFFLGDNV